MNAAFDINAGASPDRSAIRRRGFLITADGFSGNIRTAPASATVDFLRRARSSKGTLAMTDIAFLLFFFFKPILYAHSRQRRHTFFYRRMRRKYPCDELARFMRAEGVGDKEVGGRMVSALHRRLV